MPQYINRSGWQPSEQLRSTVNSKNFPSLNKLFQQRSRDPRSLRRTPPKPTEAPKPGHTWIYSGMSNDWSQREKKPMKPSKPATQGVQRLSQQSLSAALAGLPTPPPTPASPKITTESIPPRKPNGVYVTLFHKAPVDKPTTNALLPNNIDDGLKKVKGSRIDKLRTQKFVARGTKYSSGGKAVRVNEQVRVTELYEAKQEKADGFWEKLRQQKEKEETERQIKKQKEEREKEIDALFE